MCVCVFVECVYFFSSLLRRLPVQNVSHLKKMLLHVCARVCVCMIAKVAGKANFFCSDKLSKVGGNPT